MQVCKKQDFVLATLLCRACDKHSSVQCCTRTTLTITQYLQSSKIWSWILPHRAWITDKTSATRTSYLLLWGFFHCYSFHVIPGSEGRKDAAASLYMHSTEAPTELLYDFTCSLFEFNQDRESGFFSDTRYFHDIFHGFTHTCTKTFRSNRWLGFSNLNTSIWEEFNSYIQNIKTSAKLMTQCHFTSYLQFFIHQWNKQKCSTFEMRRPIVQLSAE